MVWQIELAKMLLETGQTHLFEHWAEPGVEDDEKKAFFDQVSSFFFSFFCLLWFGNLELSEDLDFHMDFFFVFVFVFWLVDLYIEICELF